MGAPLKPIPPDRPAKLLGEKLRELKGKLSYYRMGKAVHCTHNALSTTADGSYRGWPSVEQFLDAIRKCGGTVTDQDVEECRAKHKIAERRHAQSRQSTPLPAPSAELTETTVLVPIPPPTVDNSTAGEVTAAASEDGQSLAGAASQGQPVLEFIHTAPAKAYPASLADARSVSDIVASLIDLVMDKRLDIDSWRTRGSFTTNTARSGSLQWQVLTGRLPPTFPVVRSIVERCGGDPVDVARWEQVWRRVTTESADRNVGVAQVPADLRGSEVRTAVEAPAPSDEELRRVRDGLAKVVDGHQVAVRMAPWWSRIRFRLRRRRPSSKPREAHPGADDS